MQQPGYRINPVVFMFAEAAAQPRYYWEVSAGVVSGGLG